MKKQQRVSTPASRQINHHTGDNMDNIATIINELKQERRRNRNRFLALAALILIVGVVQHYL